jgi:hypothetical protein
VKRLTGGAGAERGNRERGRRWRGVEKEDDASDPHGSDWREN